MKPSHKGAGTVQVWTSLGSSNVPASILLLMRKTAEQLRLRILHPLLLINSVYLLELGSTKIIGLETYTFYHLSWGKDSHWCMQLVSNGPCCGKLKLQLCKSYESEVSPVYFWHNLLTKWGLSNYCTYVSISPCNNDLTCWLALIVSKGVAVLKILSSHKFNEIMDNSISVTSLFFPCKSFKVFQQKIGHSFT